MTPLAAEKGKTLSSGLFALLVFVPVMAFAGLVSGREISRFYALPWALFAAGMAFGIAYTGRVSFFRRLFFGVSALAFLVHFKFSLFSGTFEASCFTGAPFCHIAIAPSFFNYLYQQYLAFMSGGWKLWGPLTLGAAWLFITLAIGRAWCSWACFYGGIDDALCARPGKPLFGTGRFAAFRDLPAALLVFMLLASLAYMLPVYCLWLCPFKLSSVIMDGDAAVRRLQYGLMAFALAALVAGTLLTKKRIFCSYLCPFAAWQAFWGRLNPFRVTLAAEKCTGCLACVASCPMSAIKCLPGGKAELLAYCNLCGQCLDACPGSGFRYTVFGRELPERFSPFGRLLSVKFFFVFSALTLGAVFSSLWAPAAFHDLVKILGGTGL